MSEEQTSTLSEGDQTPTSGNVDSETTQPKKDGSVQYTTYSKVLGEAKRAKEDNRTLRDQLAEFETAKKTAEETKLKENENYKELLARRDDELKTRDDKYNSLMGEVVKAKKRDAFLGVLGGNLDKKYWGLIDLNTILVNPETGDIDDMSVTKAVEDYRTSYKETILKPGNGGLPAQSPQGFVPSALTTEEWKRMSQDKSVSAKDMRAKMPEMFENLKKRSAGV